MRFRLANSERTILVNMDVDVLVEDFVRWSSTSNPPFALTAPTSVAPDSVVPVRTGMKVCGLHVEGNIDDLALRLSAEDFLP